MCPISKNGRASATNSAERGELDDHEEDVEGRALARAADQHAGDRQRDEHRGQVDDAPAMRPGQQ